MKLVPRSLWGQTLASTIAAIVVAQVVVIILFSLLVVGPELKRSAVATADNVAGLVQMLDTASPEHRKILMHQLTRTGRIDLWHGASPPDDGGERPRLRDRIFMRALADSLEGQSDLYWRTDKNNKLWLRLHVASDVYWISVHTSARPEPSGLILLCGLAALLLATGVAWIVTARILRPLGALKSASETLSLADLPGPIAEEGPAEVVAVSRSFNLMTRRLREADAERAVVLAGISHDVRTPLAKLKLAFAMMSCDDADLQASADRQIDAIDRILGQFLTFARGFEAEALSEASLCELVGETVQSFPGVKLGSAAPGIVTLRPEAVRRAVMNLIENALRYGRAPVSVSIVHEAVQWTIIVRDHGPGIGVDRVQRIKEPFVRGDEARAFDTGGTGLGLAIVEKVASLHGGRLTLNTLPDGFEARLELAATPGDVPAAAGLI